MLLIETKGGGNEQRVSFEDKICRKKIEKKKSSRVTGTGKPMYSGNSADTSADPKINPARARNINQVVVVFSTSKR